MGGGGVGAALVWVNHHRVGYWCIKIPGSGDAQTRRKSSRDRDDTSEVEPADNLNQHRKPTGCSIVRIEISRCLDDICGSAWPLLVG